MRSKRLKCELIVRTFCLRALYVGQSANATTEELFDDASEERRRSIQCEPRRITTCPRNLLCWAYPFQSRISMIWKDVSDMGLGTRLLKGPCKEDGLLISILGKAGAIFFTRTNVQGL